jgi:hypothetical protein
MWRRRSVGLIDSTDRVAANRFRYDGERRDDQSRSREERYPHAGEKRDPRADAECNGRADGQLDVAPAWTGTHWVTERETIIDPGVDTNADSHADRGTDADIGTDVHANGETDISADPRTVTHA